MFENKKILILGFARSGYEAAKLLIEKNNDVTLTDAKSEHDKEKIEQLEKLGVKLVLGEHPEDLLDSSFDYLIKNPGVPIDHFYVKKAKELGVKVINEAEMAYNLIDKDVTLVAITGTNGKTTTTTLTYEMLKEAGKNVHLTGNIGFPLCSFLDKLEDGDIIVMELSSQQLENIDNFKPDILVITNITPTHLDFFKTYEYYKEVKSRSFKNMTEKDLAILNLNDEEITNMTKNIKAKTKYFSSNGEINGSYIKDEAIYYYDEKVVSLKDIRVVGNHNYEDIMAAIMICKEFGIENAPIKKVLKEFKGVAHRLELVDEVNGRVFYNDSKATNIRSTQIALSAFSRPTIILMGGQERNQNFMDLKDYMNNVKLIVCYGENKAHIKEFGDEINKETIVCNNLKEAFKIAYDHSEKGDVVLLSPATASWDQYAKFEDRGDEFKELVKNIK